IRHLNLICPTLLHAHKSQRDYSRTLVHFFFSNDPATPHIYTLSLHDALPISVGAISPDGDFQFSNCLTHNYREFMSGFSDWAERSEEHTSELQSLAYLVCRLLLEKKKILVTRLHHSTTSSQSLFQTTRDLLHG